MGEEEPEEKRKRGSVCIYGRQGMF